MYHIGSTKIFVFSNMKSDFIILILGTCDTKKLRSKLRSLHTRILKNIQFLEISITKYMKR
jgi:hypothetical protein